MAVIFWKCSTIHGKCVGKSAVTVKRKLSESLLLTNTSLCPWKQNTKKL